MNLPRLNGVALSRTLKSISIVVTILVALIGFIVGIAAAHAEITAQLRESAERNKTNADMLDDHEARLRTVERCVVETATDVKWIRARFESPDSSPLTPHPSPLAPAP